MQIEDNTTPIQTNVVEETNKQEESIPDKPIQFLLTEEERNALQKLLPSGYRFEIDRKKIIEEARPAKMMEFIKNRDDFGLSRNRKQANNLEKLQRDCPEPFKKCYKVLIELKRNEKKSFAILYSGS